MAKSADPRVSGDRIDFARRSIHYNVVTRIRLIARIAALVLMVFFSLGFGAPTGVQGVAVTTLVAQASTAAPGCQRSPSQHPCGSEMPDCGISCPLQGLLMPATEVPLALAIAAGVDYPRLSDVWPGRDVAPSTYPPRINLIG